MKQLTTADERSSESLDVLSLLDSLDDAFYMSLVTSDDMSHGPGGMR